MKQKIKEGTNKRRLNTGYFFLLAILVLVLFGGFYVIKGYYFDHWNTKITRAASHIIPLPALLVNGDVVWYDDIAELQYLYEATEQGGDSFALAIEASIKRLLMLQISDSLDIDIEKKCSDDYEIPGGLNWDKKYYCEYVLYPLSIAQALEPYIYQNDQYQQSVRMEMEHVMSLIDAGISFSDLAEQYSEVASAQFNGDIGYVTIEDVDASMGGIFELKVDQVSGIIELEDRYVIAKVYNSILSNGEDHLDQIGLMTIEMYKVKFNEVLNQEYEKAELIFFIQ